VTPDATTDRPKLIAKASRVEGFSDPDSESKETGIVPVAGKEYLFTSANVDGSPDKAGVYALLDKDKGVIYYGCSEISIRARLRRHLRGDEGPCTKGARYYKREVSSNPKGREKVLLAAFKAAYKRLPRCNERSA
jgi:GIY-YIG catalytic domain